MREFEVGMRVRYKSKTFIQTLPEPYKGLSVIEVAMNDWHISDFVITQARYSRLFDADERSRVVRITSKEHGRDYNTLAIFLTPRNTTIKDGDSL